jgi:dihydrofolate reductase
MTTTYLHAVCSLDGFIADEQDGVGHLHDWYFNGDHSITGDAGSPFRVSAASAGYVRDVWSSLKVIVMGRRQFDLTNGWEGNQPAGEHVVVVSHRPKPEGWHPEAPFHFATSVDEGIAKARELAGDGGIAVGAGDVGGQALALGLIDHVAIDVVPVVFGKGRRYFGSFSDAELVLGDPDVVIQGQGVLHLRFPVQPRRTG